MRELKARSLEQVAKWEALSSPHDFERDSSEVCLATFWRQATLGVSYYRCLLPARHLPGQVVGFDISEVAWDDEKDELLLPRNRGTAVWSFLGDDARARVALAWQDLGHRTLMECDDNYAERPGRWGVNWADTHQQAQGLIGYSHEQNRHIAGLVDGMIVSTPYLAEVYGEFCDNVYVCRNSIDPYDWQARPIPDDGILRIGYMGSNVHVFDFPVIKKALKWAKRQRDVEVFIWGFDKPPAYDGNVMGWVDSLSEFRHMLTGFDIGLAPLIDNQWNRSKSDIKALEYAMAGALPVVARTESYAPWWRDQGWEYTAQTPEEWAEMLRHLVKNRDEVKEGAARAKEYAFTRSIHNEIHAWEEAILGA